MWPRVVLSIVVMLSSVSPGHILYWLRVNGVVPDQSVNLHNIDHCGPDHTLYWHNIEQGRPWSCCLLSWCWTVWPLIGLFIVFMLFCVALDHDVYWYYIELCSHCSYLIHESRCLVSGLSIGIMLYCGTWSPCILNSVVHDRAVNLHSVEQCSPWSYSLLTQFSTV